MPRKKETKNLFLIYCFIVLLFLFFPCISIKAAGVHPRLYFSSSDIPALQAKINVEPTKTVWSNVQGLATHFNSFPSSLGNPVLYNFITGLRYTSFYYAMTGDTTIGNKGKNWLLQACSWPSWVDPLRTGPYTPSITPLPYAVGVVGVSVGEAYDMLYPLMTDAERATVRQAIVDKLLIPLYSDYVLGKNTFTHGYYNRAGQLYGGIGVAALAIIGDDDSNPGLEPYYSAILSLMSDYVNFFDSEGGFAEGVSYQSFGLAGGSGGLFFIEALNRVKGINFYDKPGIKNAINFPLYFLPPDKLGDGDAFNDQGFDDKYSVAVISRFISQYNNGYAQWYYNNGSVDYSADPMAYFLWYTNSVPQTSPTNLPQSKLFPDIGWTALRTGWGSNDFLISFFSNNLPAPSGHYRAEQNSFTFDAFGKRLITEAGISSLGYNDPNYDSYYKKTIGQNTILINGSADSQIVNIGFNSSTTIKNERPAGKTTNFLTSSFYDEVTGDASTSYQGKLSKFTRDLAFVKSGNYIVMVDDLKSAIGNVEFDLLLHTFGSNTISINGDTAIFNQDPVKLYIKVLEPVNFQYSIQSGQPIYLSGADQPTSYIKLYPSSNTSATKFLYVLYPVNDSNTPPSITKI